MLPTYILNEDREPVAVDFRAWSEWFEAHHEERVVRQETVHGFWVSTVFLSLDHNHFGKGGPVLWETMVQGPTGEWDAQDRCSGTWADAEAMHVRAVMRLPAIGRDTDPEVRDEEER